VHISKSYDAHCDERIKQVASLKPGAHIHLSGVCGTGMSAVLSLLKQLGFYCTGSDKAFYPPMGEFVRGLADEVFEGYAAANIPKETDLVVIGNALSESSPEVQAVKERELPYASMPEVFSALLIGNRDHCPNSIVACGTHGKTTTSSMMAGVLEEAGRKPGYFVGGIPSNLPSNIRPVALDIPLEQRAVVLEGDEYDSAFFAKFSKFHCYRPDILLLTSLEFDHADIFESIDDIDATFQSLIERVPSTGAVLYCVDDKHLKEKAEIWKNSDGVLAEFISYGFDDKADAKITSREVHDGIQHISAVYKGEELTFKLKVSGEYNSLNALACFIAARKLGLNAAEASAGLAAYQPVARRQEILFESDKVVLMEDFAHHPTAVKKTLSGIRESYPDKKITTIFEPRSNTSRRQFFQDAYGEAFVDTDVAYLLEVEQAGGYSKFDTEMISLDVGSVVSKISDLGTTAKSFSNVSQIVDELMQAPFENDVVVIMSNGAFGGLPKILKEKIR